MKLEKVGKLIVTVMSAAVLAACLPPSEIDIQNAIHQTQTSEYLNKPKPTRTTAPTKTTCNVNLDIKKE